MRLLVASLLVVAPAGARADAGFATRLRGLSRRIEKAPLRVDLLVARARLLTGAGQGKMALVDLARAALFAPRSFAVLSAKFDALRAIGQRAAARRLLDRLIARDARPALLLSRARSRRRGGDLRGAARDFGRALDGRGGRPDDVLSYARTLRELGDVSGAVAALRRGLAWHVGAVALREALLVVELSRGHTRCALALVERTMASAAVKTQWLLRRAEILAAAGRSAEALADRRAAVVAARRQLRRRPSALSRKLHERALAALRQHQGGSR